MAQAEAPDKTNSQWLLTLGCGHPAFHPAADVPPQVQCQECDQPSRVLLAVAQ